MRVLETERILWKNVEPRKEGGEKAPQSQEVQQTSSKIKNVHISTHQGEKAGN